MDMLISSDFFGSANEQFPIKLTNDRRQFAFIVVETSEFEAFLTPDNQIQTHFDPSDVQIHFVFFSSSPDLSQPILSGGFHEIKQIPIFRAVDYFYFKNILQ